MHAHVFSGTGNALTAARWFLEDADGVGAATALVWMENNARPLPLSDPARTLLVFAFPTHGFCAPWLVLGYLWRFPRVPGADVYFVNTRAGVSIGPVLIPGVSGVATWLPIALFRLRGFTIRGALPLDMPHSWIAFGPPNTRAGIERLTLRCRRIVRHASERVLAGRTTFRWSVWLTMPLDLALLPVTISYVGVARFILGKTMYASDSCTSCGFCIDQCPLGAIELRDGRPFWTAQCESCMRCMNICPKKAIQSWISRMFLLAYGIVAVGGALSTLDHLAWWCIVTALFFPIYALLHRALGIKVVNRIFTSTSLSRYWRRYLAPGVRAAEFKKLR